MIIGGDPHELKLWSLIELHQAYLRLEELNLLVTIDVICDFCKSLCIILVIHLLIGLIDYNSVCGHLEALDSLELMFLQSPHDVLKRINIEFLELIRSLDHGFVDYHLFLRFLPELVRPKECNK